MSLDMQMYSLANQIDAISRYAVNYGYDVVRTYSDAGKSGLVIAGREALQQLIDDIQSGCADFKFVLVYDVSRWGRFQDCDESAHYEYLCKKNGVEVIYCTEQFKNDGSLQTSIIKNLKRAMAGEYSRELSARTFFGQCRIAALGFHATSTPGYGFRRLLIDGRGSHKGQLNAGEWKSIRTDRVILVPGPPEEVATVRNIFRLFVEEKKSLTEIAQRLNAQHVVNAHGRLWNPSGVRHVLLSERYIGNNIYNRNSCKLKGTVVRNPPNEWIRKEGAFDAIISRDMFERAKRQFHENRIVYSPQELLDVLTRVWREKGKLSAEILAATKGSPSLGAFRRCFGTLSNAYRLIGFHNSVIGNRSESLNHQKAVCDEIVRDAAVGVQDIKLLTKRRGCLRINGELTIAVKVAICSRHKCGALQWRFVHDRRHPTDIILMVRLDETNKCVLDYFALPFLEKTYVVLFESTLYRLGMLRMTSLRPLLSSCSRVPLRAPDRFHLEDDRNKGRSTHDEQEGIGLASDPASELASAMQAFLESKETQELLRFAGIRNVPSSLRFGSNVRSSWVSDPDYGICELDLMAMSAFVSRLLGHSRIAQVVHDRWPKIPSKIEAAKQSMRVMYPDLIGAKLQHH